MNCHDFEAVAGDLAAGRLMDSKQRENALSHESACSMCTARLADERALTNGLRYIAGTANEEAPPAVEAAILAALREQPAEPAVAQIRSGGRTRIYAAAGIAALLLIVALLALMTSTTRRTQQPEPQIAIKESPAGPQQRPSAPAQPAANSQQTNPASGKKFGSHRSAAIRPSRAKAPAGVNKSMKEAEIATDFIPLMNRETLVEMDGGQLMRVELPRSALMSFGLPMDVERATERIKADVVVGNDGLARAIRFVR